MNKIEKSVENIQQQQTDAIKILIEAVKRGQQKGCYTLEQAAQIWINGCLPFLKTENDNEIETDKQKQDIQSKGIKILIEFIKYAQNSGNGCYSLEETPTILNACSIFLQKNNETEQKEIQNTQEKV